MKYLLIPAAVYFIVTGYFLFIESKIPYYPYQHLFEFFPNVHKITTNLACSSCLRSIFIRIIYFTRSKYTKHYFINFRIC